VVAVAVLSTLPVGETTPAAATQRGDALRPQANMAGS